MFPFISLSVGRLPVLIPRARVVVRGEAVPHWLPSVKEGCHTSSLMALDLLEDETQCHRLNPAACAHSLPPSPPHCWFSLPSSPPLPSLSLSCPDFICLLIYFSSNHPSRSHFAASMYHRVLDAVNGVSCFFSIYLAVNTEKFMHAAAWLAALPARIPKVSYRTHF